MEEKIMINKAIKENFLYVLAVGVSIFLLFLFVGCVWIRYEVKNICQTARWQYGGDCVEALIDQLNDEHQGFRVRNHAIWALGQIGDKRSLIALKTFYTGNIPDKEPLDGLISQYELKKAINLVSGGVNITEFIRKTVLFEK